MNEDMRIQIHGGASLPTLIYLPGTHGDWTLAGSFRAALNNRVRFVEFAYPRTLSWSLADHAAAVARALAANGIVEGWFLGESFGSQIIWSFLQANATAGQPGRFDTKGIILAGGFARHPVMWETRLALALGKIATKQNAMPGFLTAYAKYAVFRHRKAPETLGNIAEFVRRRSEPLDAQAMGHRLRLVAENDPREIARNASPPIYCLAGFFDPIVPWPLVFLWFRRHCPSFQESKIVLRADHNVLGTAPAAAAAQVLKWMKVVSQKPLIIHSEYNPQIQSDSALPIPPV